MCILSVYTLQLHNRHIKIHIYTVYLSFDIINNENIKETFI